MSKKKKKLLCTNGSKSVKEWTFKENIPSEQASHGIKDSKPVFGMSSNLWDIFFTRASKEL